jgi:peptidoglycan hydrolase-like protein with peptidoglycan-binding domain
VEPLAAKFCNGTTVTCQGLSQWGSQNLARQGFNSTQILRNYYGNVEIVNDAPIMGITSSYPGTPLRRGSSGPYVVVIQTSLNRIAQNYPAIPKIPDVDGIYGSRTEASVRAFQQIFGLNADGIVGKATWYELVRLYTAVTRLSELRSLGQRFYSIDWEYPNSLYPEDRGNKVRHLQYMLSMLSEFIDDIPPISIDGIYGPATESAVRAAQRWFGLPVTGITDARTWDEIYDQFSGIENTTLRSGETFPSSGITGSRNGYAGTTTLTQFPGQSLQTGNRDPIRQEAVR